MIRAVVSVARAQCVIEPLELEPQRETVRQDFTQSNTELRVKIRCISPLWVSAANNSLVRDDGGQVSEVSHFSGFNTCGVQLPGLSREAERTEMFFVYSLRFVIVSEVLTFSVK